MQNEVLLSHKLQDHAYVYQAQEFDSRKDSQSTEFERRPQIFVKLSFRELCDLKLSGLHAFDNTVIIH